MVARYCSAGHAPFAVTCGFLLSLRQIRRSPHKPRGTALQNCWKIAVAEQSLLL